MVFGGLITKDITQNKEDKINDTKNRKTLARQIKGLPKQTREEILAFMELEKLEMRCHKMFKNRVLDSEQWETVFAFAANKIARYEHEATKHQSFE